MLVICGGGLPFLLQSSVWPAQCWLAYINIHIVLDPGYIFPCHQIVDAQVRVGGVRQPTRVGEMQRGRWGQLPLMIRCCSFSVNKRRLRGHQFMTKEKHSVTLSTFLAWAPWRSPRSPSCLRREFRNSLQYTTFGSAPLAPRTSMPSESRPRRLDPPFLPQPSPLPAMPSGSAPAPKMIESLPKRMPECRWSVLCVCL